jgi:putative redox protein
LQPEQAVKITIVSDEEILLERTEGMLSIEAETYDRVYSPYHMLASALATCTMGVLESWAAQASIAVEGLKLGVTWKFADEPHRVGELSMTIHWPSLPAERRKAAERAASLCPVHHTLQVQTPVRIAVAS